MSDGTARRTWGRRLRAATLLLVLGTVVAAPPGGAATTERYTYSAASILGYSSVNDDYVAPRVGPVRLAPHGYFTFIARSSGFSLLLDDIGAQKGQSVPVFLFETGADRWGGRCVPVAVTTRWSGIRPGSRIYVLIASDAYSAGMPTYDLHCTGHAVAGTADVRN